MRLKLEWTRAIPLKNAERQNLIYSADQDKVPASPGVYIFGRRFGGGFEALYVGQARDIRRRLKGQFKNLPLMMHVKNAKIGKRIVLVGVFKPKPGQKAAKSLPLIERSFIRYFLSEGHDLVNKMATRLRRHEIASIGKHPKRFIPKLMFLDK